MRMRGIEGGPCILPMDGERLDISRSPVHTRSDPAAGLDVPAGLSRMGARPTRPKAFPSMPSSLSTAAFTKASPLPKSVDETVGLLERGDYIADRSLATAVHLALSLKRPLFLEGEAGVGKTEIAQVLSTSLKRRLIRLQCYEGLDVASAVYEWDYARQMIEIRLAEAAEED